MEENTLNQNDQNNQNFIPERSGSGNSREAVLRLLRGSGDFISGESIAEQLGISRNAVWKAIEGLRKDGCRIDAVTRKGYILRSEPDLLTKEAVLHELGDLAGEMEEKLFVYEELPSTNPPAVEKAMTGAPHGTTILCGRQTRGSGHGDTAFDSPAGGIYMSMILRAKELRYGDGRTEAEACSAAVCGLIRELLGEPAVIGPENGIYLRGRKICGIMTGSLSDLENGELRFLVPGIGIRYFPGETSVCPETGRIPCGRGKFAAALIRRILAPELSAEEVRDTYRRMHREELR